MNPGERRARGTDVAVVTEPDLVREAYAVFKRAMVGLEFGPFDPVDVSEPGRFLAAFDGEQVVGSANSYATQLTVPGGARVPHAAVSQVGVLPTHRRRGVVTALMRTQLAAAAAAGESVATLRASEGGIYGRFGYGIASHVRSARIDTRTARFVDDGPGPGNVRLADDGGVAVMAPIAARAAQNGAVSRADVWWRKWELRAAEYKSPSYLVVHSTDGVDDGYAMYRPLDTAGWFTSDDKTIEVTELVALNPGAHRGLWRHLLELDLVDTVTVGTLALDDPLPLLFVDERAVTLGPVRDESWLRLADVAAALAARTYGDAEPVHLAVHDRLLPQNDGVYRIGADGAVRVAADTPAAVTVSVSDLAATYLGGTRWWRLAAAGRIDVADPAAVERLDRLFRVDREPYAGVFF